MHVTVDDVNFCDDLECVYLKYKRRAPTARELPDYYMGSCRLNWLLLACDTAFYAIIRIYSFIILSFVHLNFESREL